MNELSTFPQIIHIGGRILVNPNEIAYFEADGNYTMVHLYSNKKIIVATTLGTIENRVAIFGSFVRPNRGLIVNSQFVKSFDLGRILLRNAVYIDVPRRKKQLVYETLSLLISKNTYLKK